MTVNHNDQVARTNVRLTLVAGVVAATLGLALLLSGLSGAQTATEVAANSALLVAESPEHGPFLTDAAGRALYIFLNDTSGVSNCEGGCLVNWPPLTAAAGDQLPMLPEGSDASLLGTFQHPDGTLQVVFNGWPLYYFVADTAPGMTAGQGQGGVWYLVTPQGTGAGLAEGELGGGAAP